MNYIVVGIEEQEYTHYLMPVRCMEYDLREYERQVDKDSAQTMKAYEKNGSIYPKKSICHDFKKMVNYVHALHWCSILEIIGMELSA